MLWLAASYVRPMLADDPEQTLITVDVRATNIGKVKVDLNHGTVELLQLNPASARANYWSLLSAVDMGAGEARKEAASSVH